MSQEPKNRLARTPTMDYFLRNRREPHRDDDNPAFKKTTLTPRSPGKGKENSFRDDTNASNMNSEVTLQEVLALLHEMKEEASKNFEEVKTELHELGRENCLFRLENENLRSKVLKLQQHLITIQAELNDHKSIEEKRQKREKKLNIIISEKSTGQTHRKDKELKKSAEKICSNITGQIINFQNLTYIKKNKAGFDVCAVKCSSLEEKQYHEEQKTFKK